MFYLDGAKSIADNLDASADYADNKIEIFLMNWLMHHDVLSGYSDPSRSLGVPRRHISASGQPTYDSTAVCTLCLPVTN